MASSISVKSRLLKRGSTKDDDGALVSAVVEVGSSETAGCCSSSATKSSKEAFPRRLLMIVAQALAQWSFSSCRPMISDYISLHFQNASSNHGNASHIQGLGKCRF
jgi:hypothetical protein